MSRRAVAMAVVLGVATACTGGGSPRPTPTSAPSSATSHRGGEAVFGTQFWPQCLNPITSCSASVYPHYTLFQHILPRAMQLDAKGNFVASPMLVEAPSLANGGLTQVPFSVRFRIAPQAAWDDGSPITSKDFAFTWLAIMHTGSKDNPAAYRHDEYAHILSIDTRVPDTAIVRFDGVYSDWPDLFGGRFDYVLKAAAFPRADPEAPDLDREMIGFIPFSGGPFRLESWNPDGTVLVRNEHYFGEQAELDRVRFIPLHNLDPFAALSLGKVSAVTPEVWSKPPADRVAIPKIQILGGNSTFYEVLWLNHRTPPLDDPKVREALMYAVDRQALIDSLVKEWNPNASILNCGLIALPNVGPWCRTQPFSKFMYDPARSRSILEADGYDCSATFCTKHGKVLKLEYYVCETCPRRTLAQSLLLDGARAGGFTFRPRGYSNTIFSDVSQFPMYQSGVEGQADPTVTLRFSCDQVRSSENQSGRNIIGWCNPQADRIMEEADRELEPNRRLALMEQLYQLQADAFVSLPLFVQPAVSAWRTDMIAGPIGAWSSSPYGLFFNMNDWYLART